MDPYDLPSSTEVSKKCLRLWGKDGFEEAFLDELRANEDDLPLDEMCEDRGYRSGDDWVTPSDLKLTSKQRPVVEGDFRVQFKGYMAGGCRDHPLPFAVDGRLSFTLDLNTGRVEFSQPQTYSDYGHE